MGGEPRGGGEGRGKRRGEGGCDKFHYPLPSLRTAAYKATTESSLKEEVKSKPFELQALKALFTIQYSVYPF